MSEKKTCVSAHDSAVLTRIFNPNLPYEDDESLDPANNAQDTPAPPVEDSEAVKKAKQLESDGVQAAENGEMDRALEMFSQAIHLAPERASGYNNRAQALRLQGDVDGALDDLNKALEQGTSQRAAACQAYTQRGLIRRLKGDEEGAKEDFKNAANLGSKHAKHLLVTMNPYAALCNQMLAEVMGKIRAGEEI